MRMARNNLRNFGYDIGVEVMREYAPENHFKFIGGLRP